MLSHSDLNAKVQAIEAAFEKRIAALEAAIKEKCSTPPAPIKTAPPATIVTK